MITYAERLEALRLDLVTGQWAPSPGEITAAQALTELTSFTAESIRMALTPARTTRSRLVIAMEGVASVLSLPPIHEEESDRRGLLDEARETARVVASYRSR
ncbi:hypothetical protein ACI1MP_38020 (plasmid) [Kitasatospora griseola]|uniref:hypothetical protein n=1 Tax=Kitasatospora griseola TaxID=2064 RepID=UPI0038557DFE